MVFDGIRLYSILFIPIRSIFHWDSDLHKLDSNRMRILASAHGLRDESDSVVPAGTRLWNA